MSRITLLIVALVFLHELDIDRAVSSLAYALKIVGPFVLLLGDTHTPD